MVARRAQARLHEADAFPVQAGDLPDERGWKRTDQRHPKQRQGLGAHVAPGAALAAEAPIRLASDPISARQLSTRRNLAPDVGERDDAAVVLRGARDATDDLAV